MVGGGGDGVGSLGNHPGAGHVPHDFCPRQVAANAGLGPLTHLDFNGRPGAEIVLVHPKPPRGHLHNGVFPVLVEVLVQAALAGVVVDAQLFRGPGQAGVGVVADGAVAHGGKQDGGGELQLGRQVGDDVPRAIPADVGGLAAQKGLGLHGLPQGVDGGVRHLGGVYQELIPVDGVSLGVAHGGEQHAAAFRLAVHLLDGLAGPVAVLPEGVVRLDDFQRPGGAQGHAPVAVDALALVGHHLFQSGVVPVHPVGALALAHPAVGAPVQVAHHLIGGINHVQRHALTSFPRAARPG
ncbi:unknown [Firmicutes bacterium CAG:94]|nr:unknown [Firmicutes bacterium CAG:94]